MKTFNTFTAILLGLVLTVACTKKRQNPTSEELIETIELSGVEEKTKGEMQAAEIENDTVETATEEAVVETEAAPVEAVKERKHTSVKPGEITDKAKGIYFYKRGLRYASQKKFSLASENYLTACQFGNAQGCHKFAWQLHKAGNYKGASTFYKFACSEGVQKSCNNLGFIAEKGGNLQEAEDFYSWGCIKGYKGSCKSLRRVNTELRQAH